jgi:septum formation protein
MPMPPPIPELILASQSPRRRELLVEAGYRFTVIPPQDGAECGVCSGETPPQLVARLAFQKAADVAQRCQAGLILACDTVAEYQGQILGKPRDVDHARQMLNTLRGTVHHVYSGLALWEAGGAYRNVRVDSTRLRMSPLTDQQIEDYLLSGEWEGKAGAFGYQDGHDWLQIQAGSESNVVGLPMELLANMIREYQQRWPESEPAP